MNAPPMNNNPRTRVGRIPATLQAVFLASNRGKDVHRPPPKQVAHRVFFQNWFFQRKGRKDVKQKKSAKKEKKFSSSVSRGDPPSVGPHTLDRSSTILMKETSQAYRNSDPRSESKAPTREIRVTKEEEKVSPQDFLDNMLNERGYSSKRFKTLQTAYYNKPTALQQASYDVFLIGLVKRGETGKLQEIMESGVSPNPCNQFGESLLHMVCRRGDAAMLQVLLDVGCSLQVADDYGRTPLHDACWAAKPAFEVVDKIMEVDPRLFFMTDCRGSTPLTYVRKTHWNEWNPYLESKKRTVWPSRGTMEPEEDPALTMFAANTRPLKDPQDALTCELAKMVVCGKMHPEEAAMLKYDNEDSSTADSSDDESEYDSEDDYSDDESASGSDLDGSEFDSDSDDDSDFTLDEDEMADILNTLSTPGAMPQ